jgi:hypothetical protein
MGSPDRDHASKEFHHLDSVIPFSVEEIETVALLVDVDGVPVSGW